MNTQKRAGSPIAVVAEIKPKRDRFVIEQARKAHGEIWGTGSDVSIQTRRSQLVCTKWQDSVEASGDEDYKTECPLPVGSGKQCIDILDRKSWVAYELKSSPNNVHHEFYKDVFKVLAFNEMSKKPGLIKRFYFLAPGEGLAALDGDLLCETIDACARLDLEVIPVDLATTTLHEAMVRVLEASKRPDLSVKEIAARINRKRLYVQVAGGPVAPGQIQSRARNNPDLFQRPDGDPSRLGIKS